MRREHFTPLELLAIVLLPSLSAIESGSGIFTKLISCSARNFVIIIYILALLLMIWTFLAVTRLVPIRWRRTNAQCILVTTIALIVAMLLGFTHDEAWEKIVDPSPLHKYEKEFATSFDAYDATPLPEVPTLQEYYVQANPRLKSISDDLVTKCNRQDPHRGVTAIVGPAGAGKSFIVPKLTSWLGKHVVVRLKENKQSAARVPLKFYWEDQLSYATADGAVVSMSKMPSIDALDASLLQKMITGPDGVIPPFVVIDDLDEIHPKSAVQLMTLIDQFVFSASRDFCHIFLIGRPEAFSPYITMSSRQTAWGDPIRISYPSYSNPAQLEILVRGYAIYEILGATPPPEADWTPEQSEGIADLVKRVHPRLVHMISMHPWLSYTVRNLDLGNFACERAQQKEDWNDMELREMFVSQIFKRANETHHRPLFANSNYSRWFADTAAEKAQLVAESKWGPLFPVNENEICKPVEGGSGGVQRRDLLDYSGIAWLDPANFRQRLYRFEPFWVHPFLVEEHNKNTSDEYIVGHYMRSKIYRRSKLVGVPSAAIVALAFCLFHVRRRGPELFAEFIDRLRRIKIEE